MQATLHRIHNSRRFRREDFTHVIGTQMIAGLEGWRHRWLVLSAGMRVSLCGGGLNRPCSHHNLITLIDAHHIRIYI